MLESEECDEEPYHWGQMWRWTRRVLIGLAGLLVMAAVAGGTYEWIATKSDLAALRSALTR